MSAPEEPLGVRWEAFFLRHAVTREEEAAFRGYLEANDVDADAGVQELEAHYGEFLKTWMPSPGGPAHP